MYWRVRKIFNLWGVRPPPETRRFLILHNMKEIILTQGKIALVDDEDYEYLNQWKWFAHKFNNIYYADSWRKEESGKRTMVRMHRVILGAPKNSQVDHRDRDGLNNQRNNIRLCTNAQNMSNREGWGKTTQYKGVYCYYEKYKESTYCRIRAFIQHDNKPISLGIFKTEREAALAYNKKAKELFGEFAKLNNIE